MKLMKMVKPMRMPRIHRAERFTTSLKRSNASGEGFTLLEMIVASGIFAVVVIITIGVVIAINSAYVKSTNIQNVQDNLRFTLETLAKDIRSGRSFSPSVPDAIVASAYHELSFYRLTDGTTVGYCADAGAVKRIPQGVTSCIQGLAITDANVVIDQLLFYVVGAGAGSADGQPRVTIVLRGYSVNPQLPTSLQVQTTVTQLLPDQ